MSHDLCTESMEPATTSKTKQKLGRDSVPRLAVFSPLPLLVYGQLFILCDLRGPRVKPPGQLAAPNGTVTRKRRDVAYPANKFFTLDSRGTRTSTASSYPGTHRSCAM